jgi:hypothetical protein
MPAQTEKSTRSTCSGQKNLNLKLVILFTRFKETEQLPVYQAFQRIPLRTGIINQFAASFLQHAYWLPKKVKIQAITFHFW